MSALWTWFNSHGSDAEGIYQAAFLKSVVEFGMIFAALCAFRFAWAILRMPLDLFRSVMSENEKIIWPMMGLLLICGCASKEVGFYPPYAQLPASANDYETPAIKPIHCDGFQAK